MGSVTGKVFIVGAGPGDPALASIKTLECLKNADVVVYDHLVDSAILAHCPDRAEKIYAGKTSEKHTLSQQEINDLLCEKALAGNTVVRLKGGDPFVFGRGAEECIDLAKQSIPFEIVPGVTSATAVPAYAGIPLTHRDVSSVIHIVTGRESPDKSSSGICWESLAKSPGTKVFLMGIGNAADIVENLLANGQAPQTPAAVISSGTTPRQRTIVSTLEKLPQNIEDNDITPPGIIVVGECVKFRDQIKWYEKMPLFGKRVVVTRPREQSGKFASLLAAQGAQVFACPTIRICPLATNLSEELFRSLSGYDWIVFTSTNAVRIFFKQLFESGLDARSISGAKVAVTGSSTANTLRTFSISADFIPSEFCSEALAKEIPVKSGERIFFPCSSESRDIIADVLFQRGCSVDRIEIYSVQPDAEGIDKIKELLESHQIDFITFTSPTTVRNLVDNLDDRQYKLLRKINFASIGRVTSQMLKDRSLPNIIEAREHTTGGLIKVICEAVHYEPDGKSDSAL